LDPECITAKYITGRKIHSWASVSDVFLSKKESYLGQYVEASVVVFNDQDKLVLWQDMYRNAAQMRSFIFEKAAGKIHDAIPEVKKIDLHAVTRRRYSGNVYTSFNTLLIIGIAVSFSIFLKPLKLTPILLFPVGFLLFLFFMMGTQMNYFLIDDGYLIVKNHYFLWKNRKISLADIEEVDIETPNKRSTGLRIMLRNFNSRLYGAGSLRNKHWDELLNDFKLIGIPARDDR
jgi:hypothetical protein